MLIFIERRNEGVATQTVKEGVYDKNSNNMHKYFTSEYCRMELESQLGLRFKFGQLGGPLVKLN